MCRLRELPRIRISTRYSRSKMHTVLRLAVDRVPRGSPNAKAPRSEVQACRNLARGRREATRAVG